MFNEAYCRGKGKFLSARIYFRVEDDALVFYQNDERNTVLQAETDSTFFDVPDAEDYFEFRSVGGGDGDYSMVFHYKKIEIAGAIYN